MSNITAEEYFSNFKIVIFNNYHIECIRELIKYYQENTESISEAAKMNLQDIEKNLDSGFPMNNYKIEKK